MNEWYENSFGEDYLLVYKHRDSRGARNEIDQMISWLELSPEAKILDLCCGMGRHSLALQEAGYVVTGLDLSEALLREARKQDGAEAINWLRGDMRALPLEGGFDAVVNLFTSFGYFEEDDDHVQVLREICRVLKPGGKFVIDFLNPEFVVRHLVPHSVRNDGIFQIEEIRKIEDGYVKKQINISNKIDNTSRQYHERVKLYSFDKFVELINNAGLQVDAVYGSYNKCNYSAFDSSRMILQGRR
ncbi:class I SAM-dependent methyltransferase [Paenibacillus sp. 1A_MP2]|uniref:class I SAM-dependent methyltransferase n=1 Tax=Paenibacillus sp. 1A_MP2 TaxID=3457495 RepID=UPI003FCDDD98